jgi:hypothetical protein
MNNDMASLSSASDSGTASDGTLKYADALHRPEEKQPSPGLKISSPLVFSCEHQSPRNSSGITVPSSRYSLARRSNSSSSQRTKTPGKPSDEWHSVWNGGCSNHARYDGGCKATSSRERATSNRWSISRSGDARSLAARSLRRWYAARLVRQHRTDGSPFIVGEFIAHDSKLPVGEFESQTSG